MFELTGLVLLGLVGAVVLTGVSAGIWTGAHLHRSVVASLPAEEHKQLPPARNVLAEFGGLRLLSFRQLPESLKYVMLVEQPSLLGHKTVEYIGISAWWRTDNGSGATSAMDVRLNGLREVYRANQRS